MRSPRAVDVMVESNGFGVLGFGGKNNLSVKVQPVLTTTTQQTVTSARNSDTTEMNRFPVTPRQSQRVNNSDRKEMQ